MLWPVDTPSLNVLVRNDSGKYYVMTEPNLPESHILSFEEIYPYRPKNFFKKLVVRMWSILPPCFLLQVKEQVASLRPSGRVAKTLLFCYNVKYIVLYCI